ncbi:UNVERIFIED_CONTAM: hypothetical protein PYX00_005849 [Menopon gallinae]|uniref:Uncharacterized protein n=1 Tax=Menopon gallinae TaxID=328185 RepID=A0AAW2HTH5_9NEOP
MDVFGILASDDPNVIQTEFRADLVSQTRRSAKKDSEDGNLSLEEINQKRGKGRTGWPQHVWALELKQEQTLQASYE